MDIIDQIIQSQVGHKADFYRYDRTPRTPMNIVLDEAEKLLSKSYVVYFVNGGVPENFILQDFDPASIVYSSRYLEIVDLIGTLIAQRQLKGFRIDLAERTCLKLMAELSLCHKGDPDLAVLAFVKSVTGQRVFLPALRDTGGLLELEMRPIDEAYMVSWFFGLLHELGHVMPTNFTTGSLVKSIEHEIEDILVRMPGISSDKIIKAHLERASHLLETQHLRDEVLADFFAIDILCKATVNLLHEIGKEFNIYHFIKEMVIFLRVVSMVDYCKRAVIAASIARPEYDFGTSVALAQSSYLVRSVLSQPYLTAILAPFVSGNIALIDEIFEFVHKDLATAQHEIEEGMVRAAEFMLEPAKHNLNLMSKFEEEAYRMIDGLFDRSEGSDFYRMANSLGVTGDLLERLREISCNPDLNGL